MYTDLKKLFYSDPDNYQKIYNDRYNSDNAKRVDFIMNNSISFFVQTNDVIDLVYSILRENHNISILCAKLPPLALQQYSRRCLIDEIVLSNNIEGVHSSRKEIGDALEILEEQIQAKGKRNRFVGLVNKYSKLIQKETIPLSTCQDIRNIYDEIVLTEVVSENKDNAPDGLVFRKEQTQITSVSGKVIHRGIYPESRIIEYMDTALAFLSDDSYDILYRICLFHFMFEHIHPFYDGNGRLGRFILSYCISQQLESLLAYRISETINENVKEYYDAFEICNHPNNKNDLTPFLIMMLGMIDKSAKELWIALKEKLSGWNEAVSFIRSFDECADKKTLDLYYILLQVSLFGEKGISTAELIKALNISYNTLNSRLKKIQKRDLLITKRIGKENVYTINLENMIKLISNNDSKIIA